MLLSLTIFTEHYHTNDALRHTVPLLSCANTVFFNFKHIEIIQKASLSYSCRG